MRPRQKLLDSIPLIDITGYHDRALIGTTVYSCNRVSATLSLKVKDYFIHYMNRLRQYHRHYPHEYLCLFGDWEAEGQYS